MKVKCIRLLGHDGGDVASSPWLILDKIYHVLSIFIDVDGRRSFGVVNSEFAGEWPTIGSHQAECFEVISTVVPSNWKVWIHQNSAIGISPGAWQVPGFAEALFDHDPATYSIFDRERKIILAEDP
jgi:hypothetical protein